jgi:hypothetical protein
LEAREKEGCAFAGAGRLPALFTTVLFVFFVISSSYRTLSLPADVDTGMAAGVAARADRGAVLRSTAVMPMTTGLSPVMTRVDSCTTATGIDCRVRAISLAEKASATA